MKTPERFGRKFRASAYGLKGARESRDLKDTDERGGMEFDELCIDDWLHLERMSLRTWWICIGGVNMWITTPKNGPVSVVTYSGQDLVAMSHERGGENFTEAPR